MPKGKKQCPKCKTFVGNRAASCECGHIFVKKLRPTRSSSKKPTLFQERRDFISRMLGESKSDNYTSDMVVATKIFKRYEGQHEFLLGLRPPFVFKGAIVWLLTNNGRVFLERKKSEFDFKPEVAKEIVDLGVKTGEDKEIKTTNLRKFLDE